MSRGFADVRWFEGLHWLIDWGSVVAGISRGKTRSEAELRGRGRCSLAAIDIGGRGLLLGATRPIYKTWWPTLVHTMGVQTSGGGRRGCSVMGACTGAVGARLGVVLTGGARLVVAQGERVGCVAE